MRSTINTLPIDEVLRVKLVSLLDEFNSHRINPVVFEVAEEVSSVKEPKVIKMEAKKKRASFLEKLFMTEYA